VGSDGLLGLGHRSGRGSSLESIWGGGSQEEGSGEEEEKQEERGAGQGCRTAVA